jgi:hypothetical protein
MFPEFEPSIEIIYTSTYESVYVRMVYFFPSIKSYVFAVSVPNPVPKIDSTQSYKLVSKLTV